MANAPVRAFTAQEIESMHRDEASIDLVFAQAWGVGGGEWNVKRATSTGTGVRVASVTHSVEGFIAPIQNVEPQLIAPGTTVMNDGWRFYGVPGQDIQVDDQLLSAIDETIVFSVRTVDTTERFIMRGDVDSVRVVGGP
jgi:hypothetical protein